MQKNRLLFAVPALFISSAGFASQLDMYVSGGVTYAKLTNESSVVISSVQTNSYLNDGRKGIYGIYGVAIGRTDNGVFNRPIDLSIDWAAHYVNFAKITGTESPFSKTGSFDTLNYNFSASSLSLMLEPRFILTKYQWQPYVLIGVGASRNHAYNYSEVATDPNSGATAAPAFYDNSTTTLAYEAGIGIQKPFYYSKKHEVQYTLALDYRYMNFGLTHLGPLPGQTSLDRLHISNLDTQAVMMTLEVSI